MRSDKKVIFTLGARENVFLETMVCYFDLDMKCTFYQIHNAFDDSR